MKRRLRLLLMKSAFILLLVLSVTGGILSLPRKVEGFYYAGKLISCMCDGSDYVRFHDGFVVHYSTAHEPAHLIGRYEVKSDGSLNVYMNPLLDSEAEEIIFTIKRPRIGYALAYTPDGKDSCLLVRALSTNKVECMVAKQHITQVTIPDDTRILTTYYDSSMAVVREENKPIKKREAEQDVERNAPH